jgi:signal transduction histidine kinase
VGRKDPLFKDLKEIALAVESASDLISKLLLFGRKQPMTLIPLNINDTINNSLKILKRLIGEDILIIMDLEGELWRARVDGGSIEQVIMNLAVNARDAMRGGGKLTIKTENVTLDEDQSKHIPESRPGKFILLSVTDTGVGMDKEVFQHLFEPFFTTKEIGMGTGLGLSVVYGIVKQHEGWVNVISEKGKGATFKVYLRRGDSVARSTFPCQA